MATLLVTANDVRRDCTHCRAEVHRPGRPGIGMQMTQPIYTFRCALGCFDIGEHATQRKIVNREGLCEDCPSYAPRG